MRDVWEGQAKESAILKLEEAAHRTIRNPENSPLDFLQHEARVDNEVLDAKKRGWSEKEVMNLEYILQRYENLPETINTRKQTKDVADIINRGRQLEDLYKTRGVKPPEFVQKILEVIDAIEPEDVFRAMQREVFQARQSLSFVETNYEFWYQETDKSLEALSALAASVKYLKGDIPDHIRDASSWLRQVMNNNSAAFAISNSMIKEVDSGKRPNPLYFNQIMDGYRHLYDKVEQMTFFIMSYEPPAKFPSSRS